MLLNSEPQLESTYHINGEPGGRPFDLNEILLPDRSSSVFLQMKGNSMINAGIYNGDILIVDRSRQPQNGCIVIAIIDGSMLVRRYERTINKLRLIPETSQLSPIEVSEYMQCRIWGVVHAIVRIL